MPTHKRTTPGITVAIPGRRKPLTIRQLVLDFNGTLATDGRLIRGVAPRLNRLARSVEITVMTADTFGSARRALAKLPVAVHIVKNGRDKHSLVKKLGAAGIAAIGNGHNDVPMLRAAELGIVVIGREGVSCDALGAAAIATASINDALDLLLMPKRLIATLRS